MEILNTELVPTVITLSPFEKGGERGILKEPAYLCHN
jgi:hypothetical protein